MKQIKSIGFILLGISAFGGFVLMTTDGKYFPHLNLIGLAILLMSVLTGWVAQNE